MSREIVFGNFSAGFRQCDLVVFIDADVSVFPQIFHGNADTGLGKCQFVGDVNGMYCAAAVV